MCSVLLSKRIQGGGGVSGRASQRTPHWSRDLKGEYDFVRCKDSRGKERGTSGRGERECKEEGSEGTQLVEGMTGSSAWLERIF